MTALVDTSSLLAAADRNDSAHTQMVRVLNELPEEMVVPITVLPEADYLISERLGPHISIRVLDAIADGEMSVEPVTAADLPRILELMRQYADSNIGFVDASIVAIAERRNIRKIVTLDHRHFGMIRPRHCEALEILP